MIICMQEEVGARVSAYSDAVNSQASLFDVSSFSYDTRRLLDRVGSLSLSPEEMKELSQTLNQMSRIYGSYKVCINRFFKTNQKKKTNKRIARM